LKDEIAKRDAVIAGEPTRTASAVAADRAKARVVVSYE
jgi:hypothetical protein